MENTQITKTFLGNILISAAMWQTFFTETREAAFLEFCKILGILQSWMSLVINIWEKLGFTACPGDPREDALASSRALSPCTHTEWEHLWLLGKAQLRFSSPAFPIPLNAFFWPLTPPLHQSLLGSRWVRGSFLVPCVANLSCTAEYYHDTQVRKSTEEWKWMKSGMKIVRSMKLETELWPLWKFTLRDIFVLLGRTLTFADMQSKYAQMNNKLQMNASCVSPAFITPCTSTNRCMVYYGYLFAFLLLFTANAMHTKRFFLSSQEHIIDKIIH